MNMRKPIVFIALILCSFLLTMSACEEAARPPLNAAQRNMQDSIVTERLKESSLRMDSICDEQLESLVRIYYDSVLDVRLNEIKKLRSRR